MGQTSGKETDENFYGFSRDEYRILESNLKPVMASGNGQQLQKMLEKAHLSTTVCESLVKILHQDSSERKSKKHGNWEGLLTFLSKILRGNSDGLSEVLIRLANGTGLNNTVTPPQLYSLLCEICKCYFKMVEKTPPAVSWHCQDHVSDENISRLVYYQLYTLVYDDKDMKKIKEFTDLPQALYTKEDLESWLSKTPVILNILETVFNIAFGLKRSSRTSFKEDENYTEMLPTCHDLNWKVSDSLLSPSDVLVLNQNLPARLRSSWRLLFSSHQHGESFSQMLGRICEQGATLLIVRDKSGAVFGGFASESWSLKPQFVGSSECFLFTLKPKVGVYNSTGFNKHFMYLNLNQQTMPNGLGMGGQLEYFGLWLDGEFGVGKCSKSCTTYHSPQLSTDETFSYTELEVWAVGPKPKVENEEEEAEGGGGTKLKAKRSILDKVDSDLKMVLEMAGRGNKSDYIREEDDRQQ